MSKSREIDLQKMPKSINIAAANAVNKGLPYGNKTLGEIENKDLQVFKDFRQGTSNVVVFKDE